MITKDLAIGRGFFLNNSVSSLYFRQVEIVYPPLEEVKSGPKYLQPLGYFQVVSN